MGPQELGPNLSVGCSFAQSMLQLLGESAGSSRVDWVGLQNGMLMQDVVIMMEGSGGLHGQG